MFLESLNIFFKNVVCMLGSICVVYLQQFCTPTFLKHNNKRDVPNESLFGKLKSRVLKHQYNSHVLNVQWSLASSIKFEMYTSIVLDYVHRWAVFTGMVLRE